MHWPAAPRFTSIWSSLGPLRPSPDSRGEISSRVLPTAPSACARKPRPRGSRILPQWGFIRASRGDSMRRRTAFLVATALALGIGFFVSGPALYRTGIDLVSAAFPGGAFIQSVTDALGIPYPRPIAGVFWTFGGILAAAAIAFWMVRRATRAQLAEADPGRRGVLTGAATGAAAALTAAVGAGGVAGLRAMAGVGNEGRGLGARPSTRSSAEKSRRPPPSPAPNGKAAGSRISGCLVAPVGKFPTSSSEAEAWLARRVRISPGARWIGESTTSTRLRTTRAPEVRTPSGKRSKAGATRCSSPPSSARPAAISAPTPAWPNTRR